MMVDYTTAPVTVLITAYNAQHTIARAVRSALASPMVSRVVVVNDASTDGTTGAAKALDDGLGRLLVIELGRNEGPAAGRNYALTYAKSPFVALLDADDFFLPGRFEAMFRNDDWDLAADNIVFAADAEEISRLEAAQAHGNGRSRSLDLIEFVTRNISRPNEPRSELGFLKPVIRRQFLDRNNLKYREDLRLGEDFILYAQALARGARFRLFESCGYVAVERENSLSARHRTEDLERLAKAAWEVARSLPAGPESAALRAHNRALEVKARHRRLLDDKARYGILRSMGRAMLAPRYVMPIARSIYSDKRRSKSITPVSATRKLFAANEFDPVA